MPLTDYLRSGLKYVGLDPGQGYDTAAAGAKEAQAQANTLSDLQWNRQMQGLGQAQGYVANLQSLYNSLYSPGGGQQAPGGAPVQAPPVAQAGAPGAMSQLTPQPGGTPYSMGRQGQGWSEPKPPGPPPASMGRTGQGWR